MTALRRSFLWVAVLSLAAIGCKKQESKEGFASVFVQGTQTVFLFPHVIHKTTPPYSYTFWVRNGSALLSVHLRSDKPIAQGLYPQNNGVANQFAEVSYAVPGSGSFTHFNNVLHAHPLRVELTSVTADWVEGTLTAELEKENPNGSGPQKIELKEGRFRMPARNP